MLIISIRSGCNRLLQEIQFSYLKKTALRHFFQVMADAMMILQILGISKHCLAITIKNVYGIHNIKDEEIKPS